MTRLQMAPTSALPPIVLEAARDLLTEVFGSAFTVGDWEHTLGGQHVLLWEYKELVGHAALIERRLHYRGQVLRTGYLESVAVHPDRQGHGLGAALMEALEQVLRDSYELGALSSSDGARGFYATRRWTMWSGPLSALTPSGVTSVESPREIYVFDPVGSLQLDPGLGLTCDWRNGDLW